MMRAIVLALVWLLGCAASLAAQRAPEVHGRITGAGGMPVADARVEIVELGVSGWTDAAGTFRLRADRECRCTLRVSSVGHAARDVIVVLSAGTVARVQLELMAAPIPLPAVHGTAARDPFTLQREQIAALNVLTAGDVLAAMPGVLVISNAAGGPQHVSIRGSTAGQVLVLLDGVPLNDPLTGQADLARIAASEIESVSVLAGAQSASFGARALAGVVHIRTRGVARPRQASATLGSLNTYAGMLTWSDRIRSLPWFATAQLRSTDGRFPYVMPPNAGGGSGMRQNADALTAEARSGMHAPLYAGELRVSASVQQEERGLPGRANAPSLAARQDSRRLQVDLAWEHVRNDFATSANTSYTQQRVMLRDPAPALGLPYDDSIALSEWRGEVVAARSEGPWRLTARASARTTAIDASTLTNAPVHAGEAGVALSARWRRDDTPWFAQVQARADHLVQSRDEFLSHAITVGYDGAITLQLSHRSSYAPPALNDQFFREGIGVAANPDLRPERVPVEVEGAIEWRGHLHRMETELRASAFRADTRGLIVWQPDYRFIWSPRNIDVQRAGVDVAAIVRIGTFGVHSWFAHQRITYAGLDDVQVLYRPRHSAAIALDADRDVWTARLEARYTGTRNTAPTNLNAIPGFWTVNAAASLQWRAFGVPARVGVRVDRMFDEKESLIFGFPQPGRTIAIELTVRGDG